MMKLKKLMDYSMALIAITGILFTSCESGESLELTDPISMDEAKALIEIEDVSSEADHIVDDLMTYELYSSKSESSKSDGELTCRTKTVVEENGLKIITIDFGEACTTPNGNILSGKIIVSIELNEDEETKTVSTSYEDFFVNDKQIIGEKTVVRMKANENGNPQSEISHDIEVIFPDDEGSVKREGTKVRELISGGDTRRMSDNTYSITGYWEVTFKDGTKMEATVLEALIRNGSCKFITQGLLAIEKEEKEGTINFGDGTCDDTAIFTDDEGVDTEIVLKSGKRKRKH